MDFVQDQLATGAKLRILTVIDTFSRYAPVVDPRLAYRGADVVATLDSVCKTMGYPGAIRVDQGSEFVSRDLDLWAYQNNVTLDFSRPGKPTDNAFIEALNGRLRDELLRTYGASAPSSRLGFAVVSGFNGAHGRAVDHQGARGQAGGDPWVDHGIRSANRTGQARLGSCECNSSPIHGCGEAARSLCGKSRFLQERRDRRSLRTATE